jgi:hypothetical protein
MPVLQFPARPRAVVQTRPREINPPKLLKTWLTLGAFLYVAPIIWWIDLLEDVAEQDGREEQGD